MPCNDLEIIPLTLGQIEEMGEIEYYRRLNLLLVDTNKIIDKTASSKGLASYEIFLTLITQDESIFDLALSALELFTGRKFLFTYDGLSYVGDEDKLMLFTSSDFELMRKILSYQNYMDEPDDEENKFKPANEKAAELIRKRERFKKEIQERNKNKGEKLELGDIISIVACYSNGVNLETIWDYTIYKLYEEYVRLSLWDEYHNLQILLPYIDQEKTDINTKHWGTKASPKIFKEENN